MDDIETWKTFLLNAEIQKEDVQRYAELFVKNRIRIYSLPYFEYSWYKDIGISYEGDILRIQQYVKQEEANLAEDPRIKQQIEYISRETEAVCKKLGFQESEVGKEPK